MPVLPAALTISSWARTHTMPWSACGQTTRTAHDKHTHWAGLSRKQGTPASTASTHWPRHSRKQGHTCIDCKHSFIHLVCPGAALLHKGLHILPGCAAVGLHPQAPLVSDGQCIGGPPVAGIVSVQVVLMCQAVVLWHTMPTCTPPPDALICSTVFEKRWTGEHCMGWGGAGWASVQGGVG